MSELNPEVKKQIVNEKIQQLLAESYQQEVNKKIAESVGNEEAVKGADEVIAKIAEIVKTLEEDLQ